MLKRNKLKIEGMHCESCKTIIENEIKLIDGVKNIEIDYKSGKCKVEYDSQKTSLEEICSAIEQLNYEIKDRNKINEQKIEYSKILIAGAFLMLIGSAYFAVSKLGYFTILSNLNGSNVGYGMIFLIGLLASLHCIGMCGGLVIAYTSRSLNNSKSLILPHIGYNFGRFISYTFTGAVLGGIGSFIGINSTFTGIVTLLAGVFMILMGLSLLAKNEMLGKFNIVMPRFISKILFSEISNKKPKGPFVIGLLNGFMPCGPLQAMQVYALGTGSALVGGLSMAIYSLGTIPVMLGFGSVVSSLGYQKIQNAMKLAGLVVITLGLFTISRGINNFNANNIDAGIKTNRSAAVSNLNTNKQKINSSDSNYQTASMELNYQGYTPKTLTVKKGTPVRWVINVKQMSSCTSEILFPQFGIRKQLQYGENIIEFTPTVAGTYNFSCGMQMVWGKFIVTD